VRIAGESLYASNYVTEIRVPLSDIGAVSENRALNHDPVTVTLAHDTPFGCSITFMPKLRPFLLWRSSPSSPSCGRLAANESQMR